MLKILYIITKSDTGGAQKYVKDLAENLDKKEFQAEILYGGKNLRWLSNATHPWLLFANDWLAIFEIAGKLKNERPDAVHLNSSKAGVLGAIAAAIANSRLASRGLLKIKVIFTAHGWVFNPTNELSKAARAFYVFLHKFSAKFQDKIICVSEYDYNLALAYKICPKEKLAIIHNGINPNIKFLGKKEARETLAGRTGAPELAKKKWVGSIGRLVKEKNYETLVQSATLMPDFYFFVIGEGEKLENLKMLANKLDIGKRFFIIPPSGNDALYLKAFDVFTMTSIKEGLPYVLLEAMAAELPIVITEAGGMPELIKNHENGLMVSQKNPEALAKAVTGLIENTAVAKELAKKAREIAKDKFGLDKMVKRTEEVYKTNL